LQLHGCYRFGAAKYYRLTYEYGGIPEKPFTGLSWYAPRLSPNPPFHIVPDTNGWYEILSPADLVFPYWLLNWNTRSFSNGLYNVRVELGDAGKNSIDKSNPVAFMVDNSAPYIEYEIRWRVKGSSGPGTLLPPVCPVIRRPAGSDIELIVKYYTSADHFRDVLVYGYGCGAGGMSRTFPNPGNRHLYEHWHINTTDNNWGQTAAFDISHSNPEGVYTLRILTYSRAFNPAGSDGGPAANWLYNPNYIWSHPARHIAVINL
jgi:hypothetical protein